MPSEQNLFARGFVQEQRWSRGKEFFVLCEPVVCRGRFYLENAGKTDFAGNAEKENRKKKEIK